MDGDLLLDELPDFWCEMVHDLAETSGLAHRHRLERTMDEEPLGRGRGRRWVVSSQSAMKPVSRYKLSKEPQIYSLSMHPQIHADG